MTFTHWFLSTLVAAILSSNAVAVAAVLLDRRRRLEPIQVEGLLFLLGLALSGGLYAVGLPLGASCVATAFLTVSSIRGMQRRRREALVAKIIAQATRAQTAADREAGAPDATTDRN